MENTKRKDDTKVRLCDHKGCGEQGLYPAPKDRSGRDHYHLCLKHVQEYNKHWNFFASMSNVAIDEYRKKDRIGHRPTWAFQRYPLATHLLQSPYVMIQNARKTKRKIKHDDSKTYRCLKMFQLTKPFTLNQLKKRYHILVKRYHPDAQGGDTQGESLLKAINSAYTHLKRHSA